jgi:two-component system sensor histidine kinase AlgZ
MRRSAADSIGAPPRTPMNLPRHDDPAPRSAPAEADSRHAASGFGRSTLELPRLAGPINRATQMFDVCHVGVVLRATLFVHAVLAAGVLFTAHTASAWALQFALGTAIALPAVLAWLILSCALKQPLVRLPAPAQAAATAALGAACSLAGHSLALQASPLGLDHLGALAPAVAGGAMALVMHQWLRMQALARTPADTAARLGELQSRIRPHFLFNTLNSALALVRLDPQRAEAVLEDLAELFRAALADTDSEARLADEVTLAQRYLAIEQIRFGGRLRVSWDLDDAASAARVPPLLLQPLVENAVRHGVEPAADGGDIRISTQLKGGRVLISIVNSVAGTTSQPGHGMALANVKERLRLMHDVAAQFDARLDGDHFHVHIVVPL